LLLELEEIHKLKLKNRIVKAYRHFAWRIMVYLKAHPSVLNDRNNTEIFERVREIQIRYHLKKQPDKKYETIADFVDLLCELEARKYGEEYFVEQNEMDLYRPNVINSEEQSWLLYITLLGYDSEMYTKTAHELMISEEDD
jgi:hypothetical protein